MSSAPGSVVGWKLDPADRATLLARFPPRWPDPVADHVTLYAGVGAEVALPDATAGEIVGRADDGAGVEALVVRIEGTTDRWDGSSYHITWSLDRAAGRRAVESNAVLRDRGWTPLAAPIPIRLIPARF